jgi:hypothetical protein
MVVLQTGIYTTSLHRTTTCICKWESRDGNPWLLEPQGLVTIHVNILAMHKHVQGLVTIHVNILSMHKHVQSLST